MKPPRTIYIMQFTNENMTYLRENTMGSNLEQDLILSIWIRLKWFNNIIILLVLSSLPTQIPLCQQKICFRSKERSKDLFFK